MPEICLGKFYESASVVAEYLMNATMRHYILQAWSVGDLLQLDVAAFEFSVLRICC
jgi:hypothetical protein